MKVKTVQNCINCGAKLDALTNEHVKCAYCGTIYEKPEKEQSVTQPESTALQNTGKITQQENGNSGCGILFLIAIVIVVIALYLHKEREGTNTMIVDSVVTDTVDIYSGTDYLYGYDSPKKVYVKKNPEKLVSVSGKIYHQPYASFIQVTFKKNTPGGDDSYKIKFGFKVFDKTGKELLTGDSNEREVESWFGNESKTEEWWLAKPIPKAKSVKFYIKEIEVGKEIWKYE